jgi:hypothetical protein
MGDDRSYKNDDVRAIIDRALQTQPQEGVSHDDLLAIGAEVGLSPAVVERAALELREERLSEVARAHVVSRRRRGLLAHALVYLAVNAALFAINFLTTPGEWWVLFPVIAWGVGLLLHAVFGLSAKVSARRLKRAKARLARQRYEGSTSTRALTPGERARVPDLVEELDANDAEARSKRTS